MKTVKLISLSIILLLPVVIVSAQRGERGTVANEVLVKFKPGVSSEMARNIGSRGGGVSVEKLGDLGWHRVKLSSGSNLNSTRARYLDSGQVEAVQPNFYYNLLATPNDASFGSLYGMTKISAPQAWDLNTGSTAVVIANIDTGAKYTHEDLAANMWTNPGEINNNGLDDDGNGFVDDYYGYDFFFNDPNPLDENGHGTHTSGTLGAVGNNSIGVVGVNWNVRIMTIKIYDADGFGTTSAMLINAYNYVRLMKERGVNIRVTNNSYGGCDEACGYDQATKDAIDALGNTGVLQVFAAGNDGRNIDNQPFFPASYTSPSILSVANSNSSDTRNGSSNFGVVSVDVAAPGTSILSTVMNASNYGTLSGTSMSTPHVAGAAALLSAYNPGLSAASLKATLLNSVDVLAAWNGVVKTGGRLNVAQALQNQTVCSFAPANPSIQAPTKGGSFSVNISAAQNCDYSVKSNVNWLVVSGADTLSGNSTVTFRVTVNPTISRSGTIRIAGTDFTVTRSRS
ncbi:MAG: S8 family serine peptidase [Pyrinomonadaceae bacterium]